MSFSLTSNNIRLEGPILHATCQRSDGLTYDAILNLNDCIANVDGNLIWRDGGNFMATSQNVTLDGTILRCSCQTMDGIYVNSWINLDTGVANMEGSLKFTG